MVGATRTFIMALPALNNIAAAPVNTLTDTVLTVGGAQITLYAVLKAIAALGLLIWLSNMLVHLLDRRLRRVRRLHVSNRMLIMKLFQIVLYVVVFLVALHVLGVGLTTLSVFGGALGVGIGFGLQKIASNFISGIILLFEKSIETGDLIELSDGTTGYIRHTGARYTRVEMLDGREIFIPNEEFISQRIINWTHSHTRGRAEVAFSVAQGTDLEKAGALMVEAARSCPRALPVPEPLAFVTGFADGAVQMILYFWVADMVDGRIGPRHEVLLAISKAFREAGIIIPCPQRIVYMQDTTPEKADKP